LNEYTVTGARELTGGIDMEISSERTLSGGAFSHHELAELDPAAETLADRLKAARKCQALSQQALATRASTTQTVIAKIESGNSLRPRNIVTIAEALEVGPLWLKFGADESDKKLSSEALFVANMWSQLSASERSAVRDSVLRLSNRGKHQLNAGGK
jgi:transcriptional regulator with XRE-family HTH domain